MEDKDKDIVDSVKDLTAVINDMIGARDAFWDIRIEELRAVMNKIEKVSADIDIVKKNQIEFSKSIIVIDDIKEATKDHATDIKNLKEIVVGAKSIMWVGKIIITVGTVIGGVYAFFKHNP